MKKTIFKIGVTLLSFLFLYGSFFMIPLRSDAAGLPTWITSPPHEDQEALIVVGVATAERLEDARRYAILNVAVEVAEYIRIRIKGKGKKIRTDLEQRLIEEMEYSSGKIPLQGGLTKDWFFRQASSGRYEAFILVRYPKREIDEIKLRLQSEKAQGITRAKMDLTKGEDAWGKGRVMDALRFFIFSLTLGRELDDETLEREARSGILSLMQGLEISQVVGDGQTLQPGKRPIAPIIAKITTNLSGERLPAEGVPVRFSSQDQKDKTIASLISNPQGEVNLRLDHYQAIIPPGIKRLHAEIDMDAILSMLASPDDRDGNFNISDLIEATIPGMTFTIKIVPTPHPAKVLILVEESNIGEALPESTVAQTLSDYLFQSGFRVVAGHEIGRTNLERLREAIQRDKLIPIRPELYHEVDLVIIGRASTRRGSSNMGIVISSHADIFIKALDIKTGEVVAQKNLIGHPGFGDSLELAGIRALDEGAKELAESIVDQLLLREEGSKDASR